MTKHSETPNTPEQPLAQLTLGKSVDYADQYDPQLLQGVPRSLSRNDIGLTETLPFSGKDIWTAYELSWLNAKGKPCVAIMHCEVPYDSDNLIESKSFKLYLNSFNQSKFDDINAVQAAITQDLSACAGKTVTVKLYTPEQFSELGMQELDGENIDHLDISIDNYELNPEYLKTESTEIEEKLTSHLLKSNCLITNQPDWGSVQIHYKGPKIDREGLLRYLISFRQHNEFHEQCVERIFTDIIKFCQPQKLAVYARYTRRGGLDINPFRSNFNAPLSLHRNARQ